MGYVSRLLSRFNTGLVNTMNRNQKLLHHCDAEGFGLEIGAGYSPAASRAEGYNIEVLDHASADDLRKKYDGNPNVDISKIEDVDYVWQGEPYSELIGKTDHYDYVIASHVIEHTPNMVQFLQEIETILKPGGVLSLAVPHKMRCFDYYRPYSTTGQVLQAHIEKRKFHSPGTLFDSVAAAVNMNGAIAWGEEPVKDLSFFHKDSLHFGAKMIQRVLDSDEYIDAHNWCFTPASFRLIVTDLLGLGYISLAECGSFPSEGCEFFVSLKKGGAQEPVDRLQLLHAANQGE